MMVACDEEGSLFPDAKDLSKQAPWPCDIWESRRSKCPHCSEELEFGLASCEELEAAGLTKSEYEDSRSIIE